MRPKTSGNTISKRVLDTSVAFFSIVALSPILLIVAVLLKFTSRGPLLYRQKRVGLDGRLFDICKFRTMYINADREGPSVTAADDRRVTPIGRILRDYKLDELPQLFNVLQGDMSLVGPRPQVPQFVAQFEPEMRTIVMRVRPGITGPTALKFRHEERMLADIADRETYYIAQILPMKLKMDVDYVLNRSMLFDIRILMETGWVCIAGPIQNGVRYVFGPVRRFRLNKEKSQERQHDESLDVKVAL